MSFKYRAFGLSLQSDRAIPCLEPSSLQNTTDVVVRLLGHRTPEVPTAIAVPHHISPVLAPDGRPYVTVHRSEDRRHYSFAFHDGTQFLICDDASELIATWPRPLTVEDAATYLLGPILAFVLRLKGRVCLHASCVSADRGAVAFVGPSGAGKSTLAAAFAQRGVRVISDDIVALRSDNGRLWVDPGGPLIKLWGPSVRSLFGAPDAMPLLTPNWEKRFQPLSAESGNFMVQSAPVRVIYVLAPRQPALVKPIISDIGPSDAVMALLVNTYVNKVLDAEMRTLEFELLARLAATVPVRQLQFGDDFQFLPAVCADVLEDVAALNHAAAEFR